VMLLDKVVVCCFTRCEATWSYTSYHEPSLVLQIPTTVVLIGTALGQDMLTIALLAKRSSSGI